MSKATIAAAVSVLTLTLITLLALDWLNGETDQPASEVDGERTATTNDEGAPESGSPSDVESIPAIGAAKEVTRRLDAEGSSTNEPPITEIASGKCTLTVTVVREDGTPAAGTIARLLLGRAARFVAVDAGGVAVFADIAAGTYSLELAAEDAPVLELTRALAIADGAAIELDLVLPRFDLGITGRVVDEAGATVAGISIEARRQNRNRREDELAPTRSQVGRAVSGEDGAFAIEGLRAGDYTLSTKPTDVYGRSVTVLRAGIASAELRVGKRVELTIRGVVVDENRLPVEGATVRPRGLIGGAAPTDEEGRFELEVEAARGESVGAVEVTADGFQSERVHIPVGRNANASNESGEDVRSVEVVLSALGETTTVIGWLYGPEGEPVSGETVFLYSPSRTANYQASSNADGRFRIDAVEIANDYRLWVYPKSRYADHRLDPVAITGDDTTIEVELRTAPVGRVTGFLIDPSGAPIGDFSLWVRSMTAQGVAVSIRSGPDGRFEANDVPAGDLLFETRSVPFFRVKGYRLDPNGEVDVRLPIDWGASDLSGTVTDTEGAPLAAAKVQLHWSHDSEGGIRSTSYRTAHSDAEGRFIFRELGTGVHRLTVAADGYRSAQLTHIVGENASPPTVRLHAKAR